MTLALSRAKALVLAFVLALVAAFGLAAQAHAVISEGEEDLPPSVVNPNEPGSLTVHKILRDSPATEQNLTGAPVEDPSALGKPVSGVKFKLYNVDDPTGSPYDLSTIEGLKAARELVETAKAKDKIDETAFIEEGTTTADGTVKFGDVYPGLYVVAEQPSPDATADGESVVLNPSEPFFVFVPMTNADRTGWNYDVHAYPKNSTSTITKEVSDEATASGDDLTYTLKSDVPVLTKDGELSKYSVIDQLDPRLTIKEVSVKGSEDTQFAKDTDYTLTQDTNKVVVTFTDAGLKKLADLKKANNDIQVVTSIKAELPQIKDGSGIIENEASLIPNEGVNEGDIKSNKVVTKLSKVHLTKVFKDGKDSTPAASEGEGTTGEGTESEAATTEGNSEGEGAGEGEGTVGEGTEEGEGEGAEAPAEGEGEGETQPAANGRSATFQVYRCYDSDYLIGDPLTIAGQDEFTTDENGELTIDALQYSNFFNNEQQADYDKYCLVETKTADGYELLPEPIEFEITEDTVKDNVVELGEIENLKETGVTLPFTGGHGIGLLLGLGAVVVAGGVLLAVRSSRRSKAQG